MKMTKKKQKAIDFELKSHRFSVPLQEQGTQDEQSSQASQDK
jgi:hypothetical protein